MVTRDRFLAELRKLARKQKKLFEIYTADGKGSHYRISREGRKTTIKSGDLSPSYIRLIRKQLGIDDQEV